MSDRLRLPIAQVQPQGRHLRRPPLRPDGQPARRGGVGRAASTSGCPRPTDKAYLHSLQATPVYEPGKIANYIAPPQRGINRKPIDFEYVRTEA